MDGFGAWSTCIGFTSLALLIHASILIVPVIVVLVSGMPEEGYPDRPSEPLSKVLRGEGDGDLRIGTLFQLREDMYALALLCYLDMATLDEALEFEEDKTKQFTDIGLNANKTEEDNDDDYQKVNEDGDTPDKAASSASRK